MCLPSWWNKESCISYPTVWLSSQIRWVSHHVWVLSSCCLIQPEHFISVSMAAYYSGSICASHQCWDSNLGQFESQHSPLSKQFRNEGAQCSKERMCCFDSRRAPNWRPKTHESIIDDRKRCLNWFLGKNVKLWQILPLKDPSCFVRNDFQANLLFSFDFGSD